MYLLPALSIKAKILLSPSFRCYRNIRSTKLGAKIKDRLLHTHFNVANRPFVVAGGSLGANVSEASNGIFSSHHKTPLWKGEKKGETLHRVSPFFFFIF